MFENVFHGKKDKPAPQTTNTRAKLYPSPDKPFNMSGSDKFAFAVGFEKVALTGLGDIKGLKSLTGASAAAPFAKAMGNFGHKSRQGLKSLTSVKRGI